MDNELHLNQHISKKYNEELEELREQVMSMGGLVESQLKNSLKSLVDSNIDLAKSVIKKDDEVNQMELDISARCVEIIALRQPTASDLRLILSVDKCIADLERVGDLSYQLGKLSKKLIRKGISNRYYAELQHLCKLAQKMLTGSLNAFARLDAEAALEIMEIENQINRESEALSRQLITYMMEDPRSIKHTLRVLNAAKVMERIGDHCENLCEHVIYLVKGEDIRHQHLDEVRASLFADDDE